MSVDGGISCTRIAFALGSGERMGERGLVGLLLALCVVVAELHDGEAARLGPRLSTIFVAAAATAAGVGGAERHPEAHSEPAECIGGWKCGLAAGGGIVLVRPVRGAECALARISGGGRRRGRLLLLLLLLLEGGWLEEKWRGLGCTGGGAAA